jgi:hypothetical protein
MRRSLRAACHQFDSEGPSRDDWLSRVLTMSRKGQAHVMTGVLAIALLAAPPAALHGQLSAPGNETVTIDGKKHPEQIAQWDAWGFAFRFIASAADTMGNDGVPTSVYYALNKEERAALIKQVYAAVGEQKACQGSVLKLREQLGTEKAETLLARTDEIRMNCRRATLRARDEMLAALPPAGQMALKQFVETQKSGMTVTLRKSDLLSYRIPE